MNITLIGMSGIGKSIIGKELAKRLKYRFIDTDKKIEEIYKSKLQKILDNFGDEKFLEIEEKTILNLGKIDNYVISPGGSIVYLKDAMKFLKKNSIVIFLNAPLKFIKNRTSDFSQRGIVGYKTKRLKTLFNERYPLYKQYADITINLPEDFDMNTIMNDIIKKIREYNKLT